MKKIYFLAIGIMFIAFQTFAQSVTVAIKDGNPDNCTGNSITGSYTVAGQENGKNKYVKGIHTIKWTGSKWAMTETSGSTYEIYYNNTATAIPPCGDWNGTFGCFIISVTGNCASPCTNPTVPIITASPASVCSGNTTNLSISGNLNDATKWFIYSGSCGGTFVGSTTSSTFQVTPTGASTTYFVRGEGGCVTAGSCGSKTVSVSTAQTANAGPDQNVCGTSTSLAGNSASGGAWSIISGAGGSITSPNSNTSTFSGVAGTSYTLRWTLSNGACTASSDDVVVTFSGNPTVANAGADQNVCGTTTTLAGNSVTNGHWSIISGAGGMISTPTSNVSAFSGSAGATYTLRWTSSNGTCSNSTDDVIVSLKSQQTANAGSDQNVCGTTTTLAGNNLTNGTWSIVSGAGGSIVTPSSNTSIFTGSAGISYTLRWSTNDGVCQTSIDEVVVTFYNNPTTANAGVDQTTCSTAINLAGNAILGFNEVGTWSLLSGAGGSITAPTSNISAFSGTVGTSYLLRWTSSNGVCPNSSDDVMITIGESSSSTDVVTSCGSFQWIDGKTYNQSNTTATFTLENSTGCDSVITLNLTINAIDNQNVSVEENEFCSIGSTVVNVSSTQQGVNYYLRKEASDLVVAGPVMGTGSNISLNIDTVKATTTYNVFAEKSFGALKFTGNTGKQKVSLGTSFWNTEFAGSKKITVEAWIKRTSMGSLQTIISNYEGSYPFLFRIDNDKLNLFINNALIATGSTVVPVGTWTHVAAVYDGSAVKLYMDGVQDGSASYGTNFVSSGNEFKIGGGLSNGTEFFSGNISDVRIWNVARSVVEINNTKDELLNGNENGLVVNYQFNEGNGSSTVNNAGNGLYLGTFVNNPTWAKGPSIGFPSCSLEMSNVVIVTINNATAGIDVQIACDSYLWPLNNKTYTSSTTTPTVTLENAAGCDSIVTLDLTINTSPIVVLDPFNPDTSCDMNALPLPVGTPSGGDYTGEGVSGNEFFPSNGQGVYDVVYTYVDGNNCSDSDTATIVVEICTGVNELKGSKVSIHPNPSTNRVNISLGDISKANLHLISSDGKVVYESYNVTEKMAIIDISDSDNGIYFLKVESDSGVEIYKVVKQ